MRSVKKSVVVLLFLGLATGGCNRGPAEEALGVAEEALADAQADLERFAPEKLAPLNRALDDARAALVEGRYTEALRVAQELPARTHRAVEAADRRRTAELALAWDDISRTLPAQLARLRARMAGLALTPGPGGSPDDGRLEATWGELRALSVTWEKATVAFEGGDVAEALTMARAVGTRAEALALALPPPNVRRVEPPGALASQGGGEPQPE